MRHSFLRSFAAALTLALACSAGAQAATSVKVAIRPEVGFYLHEHGTAVLVAKGDQTEVTVHLFGVPRGAVEPIHIHPGQCGNLNPKPAYALSPVKDGRSVTTIPVALKDLQTGDFAINAHKSAKDIKVYVACGNIPKA